MVKWSASKESQVECKLLAKDTCRRIQIWNSLQRIIVQTIGFTHMCRFKFVISSSSSSTLKKKKTILDFSERGKVLNDPEYLGV